MQNDVNDYIKEATQTVVELLVAGKYTELASLTGNVRLNASEIEEAITSFPKKITQPAEEAWSKIDIVKVKNSVVPTYSVRFDLWAENQLSDLSLEMTLIEVNPKQRLRIEIDNIHVL
jgi:hypothetical protein